MMVLNGNSRMLWVVMVIALGATLISVYAKKGRTDDVGGSKESNNLQNTAQDPNGPGRYEKATFAAGCFWGVEAAFRQVRGVISTTVGYTGGRTKNPTYQPVCSGRTGHAEAVEVIYDPKQVSYERLLEVFWSIHDPTTPNRQGPDVGSQYRSAIFYHGESQHKAAEASKERLEKSRRFGRPIATQIRPASVFYRAEEYHQRYLEKQGRACCHLP